MSLSTNRLLTAEYIFTERVGKFHKFELLNYGKKHPESICKCLEIKVIIDSSKKDLLNNFLNLKRISNKEIISINNSTVATFTIANNSVRNYFMDLYSPKLPIPKANSKHEFFHNDKMELLIYKSIKLGTYEFKILNSLCKDTKDIQGDVESAIYLKRRSISWFIEGTGCSCSNFKPIPPSEISKENISKLIDEANNQFEIMKRSA